MKCQMRCGACKNEADLVLHSGGKEVNYLSFATVSITKHRAPKRDIYACIKHKPQLESCAEMYGGAIEELPNRNRVSLS